MPRRNKVVVTQVAIVLALVLIWELGVRLSLIDAFFFPAPSTLVSRIRNWTSTADFLGDVGITLVETILSFVFGIAIGTALGIWLELSPFAADVVQRFIIFNAIPRILLGPIFVIWFGLGLTSKVALGVTLVLVVAFLQHFPRRARGQSGRPGELATATQFEILAVAPHLSALCHHLDPVEPASVRLLDQLGINGAARCPGPIQDR